MGEGAGGRGVFGLSAGARFARPSLAYPVGGTEEGGPLIRRGSRRDTFPPVGGRLLGRLEACGRSWASAQGRGLPPPVSGMLCDWDGGRRTPHPPRLAPPHLPPQGEGFWGGWKPAGDLGPLRRGGACPRLSLACSVTGTGGGGPLIRHGSRRHTFPPVGGRLLGRLEACGRFWASAQGRGLPPPVSGMFCDWYGGRRPPHPPRLAPRHLPPCGGKAFGAAGSLREILGLCAGAGLVPACLWHAL